MLSFCTLHSFNSSSWSCSI